MGLSPPLPPTQPQVWQKAGAKHCVWTGPREWRSCRLTRKGVCFGVGEWIVDGEWEPGRERPFRNPA